MKSKEKSNLRLVRWFNDGMPPIDLSNEAPAVLEIIRAYLQIKSQNIELMKQNVHLMGESEQVMEMNVILANEIKRLKELMPL